MRGEYEKGVAKKETTLSTNNPSNSLTANTKIKDSVAKSIPPKIPIPPPTTVIKCFNPNLELNAAIELINSGVESTQYFVVERKTVRYQKEQLDATDTIWIQTRLQALGWKLIDSSQTVIGNQHKIILRMQNKYRVCNIEKILYRSTNKTDNLVEEWFDIKKYE